MASSVSPNSSQCPIKWDKALFIRLIQILYYECIPSVNSFCFFITEFGVHLAELTVDPQGALAIRQVSVFYISANHLSWSSLKQRIDLTVLVFLSDRYSLPLSF